MPTIIHQVSKRRSSATQSMKKGLISGKHKWCNDLCDVVVKDQSKLNDAIVTVLCRVDDGRWSSQGCSKRGYDLKCDQRQVKLARTIHLVHKDSGCLVSCTEHGTPE
jgi:hypothetical protein